METFLDKALSLGSVVPAGLTGVLFLLIYYFLHPSSEFSQFPRVGVGEATLQKALIDGYKAYRGAIFTIPETPPEPDTLVLPEKYLDEVKSLPESQMSFANGVFLRMAGKYTSLGVHDDRIINSVKIDLTRNIARTLEGLQDEADFAIPSCIGDCEDWTPVAIYPQLLRIVALLSGRIFVGLPLCRNEEWLDTTINYTLAAFRAVAPVKNLSPLTRGFFAPYLKEVQRLHQYRINGARMLNPILKERHENLKDPNFEPPIDMLQFVIQNSGHQATDALFQAYMQMLVSLAAIHTTSMALTHVIYDLALHPEYVEVLREELEPIIAQDNGRLLKTSVTKLKKMDSVLKETQRMNPPNCLSLNRLAMYDVVLSDGTRIPKGRSTAFSSIGASYNPEYYPDPYAYKPWRFAELREQPGNENKYQFVTTGPDSITFGHGRHACPGRFFASNEMKIILAWIIMRYDFRFREGEKRPENIYGKTHITPNPKAEVLFRKRASV